MADDAAESGPADIAMQRWYELDPEAARTVLLADIASADPHFSAETLTMLPDKTPAGAAAAHRAEFSELTQRGLDERRGLH